MYMADKAKLTRRMMGKQNKREIFHTSGYAQAQSGENFGAAGTESFGARQSIEDRRKFVRGYNNARLVQGAYGGVEKARTYTPRTDRHFGPHSEKPDSARSFGPKPEDPRGGPTRGNMNPTAARMIENTYRPQPKPKFGGSVPGKNVI